MDLKGIMRCKDFFFQWVLVKLQITAELKWFITRP